MARLEDMKVQLGVFSAYHEGFLRGKWYSFPLDEEKIREDFGKGVEEICLFDFEEFPSQFCSRFSSIAELNLIYRRLEVLNPFLLEHLEELMAAGYELEDIERIGNDFYYHEDCCTMADFAKHMIWIRAWDVPDSLRDHLDYEAIGRNLVAGGNFVVFENGVLELY